MDSLSHIIIGAAIGEVAVGKKIGRWGMLIGAVAKSIPDFDLFYTGLSDPRAYMCQHRAHTHSLFIEALYAIPLAYLLAHIFKNKVSFRRFLGLMLVCLWGHSLLDWCTNFGTQLLLPFSNSSYSLNTLSIVDLLFTLPMLFGITIAIFYKKNSDRRQYLAKASLVWCFFYLGMTFFNKYRAETIAKTSILQENIPATAHLTNPTILNNVLWYALASNDSTIFVSEYSLFSPHYPIVWRSYPRKQWLMARSESKDDVARIRWFSDPYTLAEQSDDTLRIYGVKFGRTNFQETELAKTFDLHYKLFKKEGNWQMGMKEPTASRENIGKAFTDLWERICGRRF